jgi:SAM-dependent methyltransferase
MKYSDLPPLARRIVVSDQVAVDHYFERLAEPSVNRDNHDDEEYVASLSIAPYAKNIGIANLLGLLELRAGQVVVDVLGGAGQVAMAARRFGLCGRPEQILTADEDVRHIVQALQQQLAALPLDPTDLRIVAPGIVDHVLVAHHVHHISPDGRQGAIEQAVGALRPGGTLVIYEGPRGSSTAHLSDTVVDELSAIPHTFPHPTRDELLRLADHPLLRDVRAVVIESPLVFLAHGEAEAQATALDYYIRHYSLHPDTSWSTLRGQIDEAYRRTGNGDEVYIGELSELIEQQVFPLSADRASHLGTVCVIVPREGLAVIATKSAD